MAGIFDRRKEQKMSQDGGRLPPGQVLTEKFPVLHYGPIPAFDESHWDFKVWGAVEKPLKLTWYEFNQLPKVKRYLAYLPEGPELDWERADVKEHLDALVKHAKKRKAFAVRIGPWLTHRRWQAPAIKEAVADENTTLLSQKEPDETSLVATRVRNALIHGGWVTDETGEGFAAGQPKFNFQLPLRNEDGSQKTEDELLKGMNQQWRRNIRKAAKEEPP